MNNCEIKALIEDNYNVIGKLRFKILEIYSNKNKTLDDTFAALKINEIILLELKYKKKFNDKDSVIKLLKKMYSNLSLQLASLSDS
jgi:hypothetical protein